MGMTIADVGIDICATAAAVFLTGDALQISIAIAGAESSWRVDAVNRSPGETPRGYTGRPCASWGAWQINNCPDRDGNTEYRGGDHPEVLLDPLFCAHAMDMISGGGNSWSPWTTYNNGAYLAHMQRAGEAIGRLDKAKVAQWKDLFSKGQPAPGFSGGGSIVGDVAAGVASVVDPFGLVRKAGGVVTAPLSTAEAIAGIAGAVLNPATWLRVLLVVLGLVLIAIAAMLLSRDLVGPAATTAALAAA